MGEIADIYEDLEADLSLEEFREAVAEKVEQMGGLADEETAAKLVAHEHADAGGEVERIADVETGMEEVKFVGKVLSVGERTTFERDDDEEGQVLNVEVADESASVRCAFWDERAERAREDLAAGDVLRIKGRPQDGYRGLEVNVDRAEGDPDAEVDVQIQDTYRIEDLSLGLSDVDCEGRVLSTDAVRTFERDDGSEGRVANLTIGDPTGRVRVTLWDERADRAEELDPGTSVAVLDGYVRERDGDLELHVGDRGAVEEVEADVAYEPESTPIADVEIGETVDVAGVVRSADPKRTFDRDDGSEGQVRNVRIQDDTGDIRVALWGEKADLELAPGDEVAIADVEIQDGWQDDLEAAANWRSAVTMLDGEEDASVDPDTGGASPGTDDGGEDAGLEAFASDEEPETNGTAHDDRGTPADGEHLEFTGTVVQAGDPVVLDDGEETVGVETDADVALGETVTVTGTYRNGRLRDAEIRAADTG